MARGVNPVWFFIFFPTQNRDSCAIVLRHTLPSLNSPLVPCVFFYSKMPTKRGWVCSCSCMTARAWPASVIRHSTGSPGAEDESLFDFLLSSFLIASKATKCCCSFYRTNWRLAVTILCFYFHRSLCRSGTLSLILTASQQIAKRPCNAGR